MKNINLPGVCPEGVTVSLIRFESEAIIHPERPLCAAGCTKKILAASVFIGNLPALLWLILEGHATYSLVAVPQN